MRILFLLALLPLAACESDFWNQPAQPAPSGVGWQHLGADPDFTAKGSQATYGNPVRSY